MFHRIMPSRGGDEEDGYERHIGLKEGIGLLIGVIMGSGIFASPGFVVQYVVPTLSSLLVSTSLFVSIACPRLPLLLTLVVEG
jgi:hypothetical protein